MPSFFFQCVFFELRAIRYLLSAKNRGKDLMENKMSVFLPKIVQSLQGSQILKRDTALQSHFCPVGVSNATETQGARTNILTVSEMSAVI